MYSVYLKESSFVSCGGKASFTERELVILSEVPGDESGLQNPDRPDEGFYEIKYHYYHSFGDGFSFAEIWEEMASQYKDYERKINETLDYFGETHFVSL